jgi:protocatechuate 3,4-dioxygenase beta subunit
MKHRTSKSGLLTRREVTGGILAAMGGVAVGCAGQNAGLPGTGSPDSGSPGSGSGWASGGTKSMMGNYADPFAISAPTACMLIPTSIIGPCTEATDRARRDVSEGYTGLPMRLAFRVVDTSCKPISGANVKIWHTQITGSYSGDTPNNNFCLKSPSEASKHYFRGVQTTDANGRVDFDSCFPGWYMMRAVHLHFTVALGAKMYTSQLIFKQDLVDEIFANHPEYKTFGTPDTTNARDLVTRAGDLNNFILDSSRMSDGALMASKLLVVSVT